MEMVASVDKISCVARRRVKKFYQQVAELGAVGREWCAGEGLTGLTLCWSL